MTTAVQARDEAMSAISRNTSREFSEAAQAAIRIVAAHKDTFLVDDVWVVLELDSEPHDRRALGPEMIKAVKMGVIERTNEFRPSTQVQCHANPRRVWRAVR